MAVYWVSFRLANETTSAGTYTKRYDNFIEKIKSYVSPDRDYWHHTTSFFVLRTNQGIKTIGNGLKSVLTSDKDHFLMRNMERKEAIMFGKNHDADIFKLLVDDDGKQYLEVIT